MSTVETPELLTVAEAAVFLRVSRATAYRLAQAGELPAVRVGGQYRVDADELREQVTRWRRRGGRSYGRSLARLDELAAATRETAGGGLRGVLPPPATTSTNGER